VKTPGVTLAETVISLFILVSTFAVMAALLHSGMRWQGRIEQRTLSAQLAKKRLAELRAWARTHNSGNNYNYDAANPDWETALEDTDPDYPGLVVTVKVVDRTLFSPNTAIEAPGRWRGWRAGWTARPRRSR